MTLDKLAVSVENTSSKDMDMDNLIKAVEIILFKLNKAHKEVRIS